MARHLTPTFRPGPLTRADADRLNEVVAFLVAAVGDLCPAPPLEGGWDRGGITLRLNTRQLSQSLGSSSYPLTADNTQYLTSSPTDTWAVAAPTWTWTYTTSLTISLPAAPLIFGGTGPVVFNDAVYYAEETATWNTDHNDYALGAATVDLRITVSTAGGVKLTGMDPGAVTAGLTRSVWVTNDVGSSGPLTLTHQDAASAAAKRFNLPNAASYVLNKGDSVKLWCSGTERLVPQASWNCGDNNPATGGAQAVAVGGAVPAGAASRWYKITVGFGAFGASPSTITLCTIPAGAVIEATKLNATTQFTGGTANSVVFVVKSHATPPNFTYWQNAGVNWNTQAVNTPRLYGNVPDGSDNQCESQTGAATIDLVATYNGTGLTAGSLDVYLLVGTAA